MVPAAYDKKIIFMLIIYNKLIKIFLPVNEDLWYFLYMYNE